MDLMPGYLSRMTFHRFDLPLPVFRGSKGLIWKQLSLQQLRRPYRIHTPLVSANAVIMWCMECIWISYCLRLFDSVRRRGFLLLLLYFTCISPFSTLFAPFLGQEIFYLILWLSMCLLSACMFLGGCVVWRGSSLSLSLWIVTGMVVEWRHSRGVGEAL